MWSLATPDSLDQTEIISAWLFRVIVYSSSEVMMQVAIGILVIIKVDISQFFNPLL